MKFPLRCILAGIYLFILVSETDTVSVTPKTTTTVKAPAQTQPPPATNLPAQTQKPSVSGGVTQSPINGNNGQSPSGGGGNGGNRLHQQTTGTLSKFTGMLLVTFFINRYLLFL